MLREHEKFWAFMALGAGVLLLACLAVFFTPAKDEGFRILDGAMGGFLLAMGAAANALFRINQADKDTASALKDLAQKTPPATGEAKESLQLDPTPQQPVSVRRPLPPVFDKGD